MDNKINIIFENSDLHIQENLNPSNIKIFFGEELIPTTPCDFNWLELDGDAIDLDCSCSENWFEIDGDQVDLNLDCSKEEACDFKWKELPPGESVDFNCLCPTQIKDTNDFIIECEENNKTELGRFNIDAGEAVKFEIQGLEIYNAISGEKLTAELDIKRTEIKFAVIEGSKLENVELITSKRFEVDIKSGEQATFDFIKPFNPNLDFDQLNVGEYVDLELSTTDSLTPYNINHGEHASVDIMATYAFNFENIKVGEDVFITFYESVNSTFRSLTSIGEQVDTNISTTLGFNVEVIEGQSTKFDLSYDPYTGFPFTVYAGEALNGELSRNRLLYPDVISMGEVVNTEINVYPFNKIASTIFHGEIANFKLLADVRLGEFYNLSGEQLRFKLDELENYEVKTGEQLLASLATSSSLSVDPISHGEKVYSDFKRGIPATLSFEASAGEYVDVDVKSLRSYTFQVKFTTGERVYPNDWVNEPISIDLDDRHCCDIMLGDLKHVELDLAPYNHTSYAHTFKVCELMTFDLSSRRALSFEASSGEHFDYDNNVNTFSFNVYEGQKLVVPNFRTIVTTDLEDGNQLPEVPVIDIDRPEIPNEVKYTMMATGERAEATLSVTYSISQTFEQGETLSSNLLTNPPFLFRTYGGEYVYMTLSTNMQFPCRAASGEDARFRMYEEPNPLTCASGEYMSLQLETKSDYYAEFVTEGCLNNDYQDIDPESGQPLPQEYNGTSVEGEMFSKYVVGRCF